MKKTLSIAISVFLLSNFLKVIPTEAKETETISSDPPITSAITIAELKQNMNPATNPYGATGWNYWWDTVVPNNPGYMDIVFDSVVTSDNTIYAMLWDRAIPQLWSSQAYYNYFWNSAVPEKTASGYYYERFWSSAVPNRWAGGFYYTRLWDKAVPENWMSGATFPYRSEFWNTIVPAGFGPPTSPSIRTQEDLEGIYSQLPAPGYSWAGHYDYYLWNKAVPELWDNQYYYNYLFNNAIPYAGVTTFYYNYVFWIYAVPELWKNSFYYTRMWDKIVPEDWIPESGPPVGPTYNYKWLFWTVMVPSGISSYFYTDRFWNSAVPNHWASNYYANTLTTATNDGWAGGYYGIP